MATCRFCGKGFANSQAVRAHLKGCDAYIGKFPRHAGLPEGTDETPTPSSVIASFDSQTEDFDPVAKVRQQVSAEKLRLTLREVRQAHGELDAREEARRNAAAEKVTREAESRAAAEREREAARARAVLDAQARRAAEDAEERRKIKRREAIQRAKLKVVDQWWGSINVSAALKAQILQAIEVELAALPVDELPEAELVQIAEGTRDRLYGQAVAAQQAATARLQRKQALQQYGLEYAQKELREIDGLNLSERWDIEALVKDDLESLHGDESRADVKDRVEAILDEEGLGMDDEDKDEDE